MSHCNPLPLNIRSSILGILLVLPLVLISWSGQNVLAIYLNIPALVPYISIFLVPCSEPFRELPINLLYTNSQSHKPGNGIPMTGQRQLLSTHGTQSLINYQN